MKAERKGFQPIILTLESQAEVDAVFTLLNHGIVREAVELPYCSQHLQPYEREENTKRLHDNLDSIIKQSL